MPSFEIERLTRAIAPYFPSLVRRLETGSLVPQTDLYQALADCLDVLDQGRLSWSRFNQVLHRASEAGMSEGFFRYYFLRVPETHPYPVERVFDSTPYRPPDADEILSLQQLHWGLRRFLYDAMLYWGNFRQAYRDLRQRSLDDLTAFFAVKRYDEGLLRRRGAVHQPTLIAKDRRYLISEMACKTCDPGGNLESAQHVQLALRAFRAIQAEGRQATRDTLKAKAEELAKGEGQLDLFQLMYEEADTPVNSEAEVIALYSGQWEASRETRRVALDNTRIYLSFCNDLDVYVATSMRTRQDFREMGDTCERIFTSEILSKEYHTRYFDPTLSAAKHHEDKGIIECLMVKTAKVLLYFAQHKESFGKVSECAMALSLGKPVIILCPDDARGHELYRFYRDSHPLTRLVQFTTGIVNGAMITHNVEQATMLIGRILGNRMEYDLSQKAGTDSYYLLRERLTGSTIRVVTDDYLLTETFWNNWHGIS
jgi:hypothetical protein